MIKWTLESHIPLGFLKKKRADRVKKYINMLEIDNGEDIAV